VDQNMAFNPEPVAGTTVLPTGCSNLETATDGFYDCPAGLGQVNKTIGSARQIQMSLSVLF